MEQASFAIQGECSRSSEEIGFAFLVLVRENQLVRADKNEFRFFRNEQLL